MLNSVILRFGLIVACLCLATFAVLEGSWRFEESGDSFSIEPPDVVPRIWVVSPQGVSNAPDDEGGGLVLDADASAGVPYVTTVLRRSSPYSHLKVSVDLKIEDLRVGNDHWKQVGLLIISLGERLRTIAYWPKRVFTLDEDQDWKVQSRVFPLHGSTEGFRLILYNAALDGRLGLRRIELVPLYERDLFVGLRYLLCFLWAALFVFCAWSLLRQQGRKIPRAALILLFGLSTAAIVLPQPYYGRIVLLLEGVASDLTTSDVEPPALEAEPLGQEPQQPSQEREAESETDEAPAAELQEPESKQAEAKPKARTGGALRIGRRGGNEDELFDWLSFKEIAHYSMFLALALLSLLAFRREPMLRVLTFLMLYAISTEFLQFFLATRSTNVLDVLINGLGICTGALIYLGVRRATAQRPDPLGGLQGQGPNAGDS